MLQALLASGIVLLNTQLALPPERVNVELTRPIVVPGATLAPGWYLFAIGRTVGGQTILDIHSADGSRRVVSCLTVKTGLPSPGTLESTYYPLTAPQALRVWVHPINQSGYELVYPAGDAWRVFEQSGVSVPFTPSRTFDHELVGTFTIRRTGADAAGSGAVGTGGSREDGAEPALADHLIAARLLIASRGKGSSVEEAAQLRLIDQQIAEIAGAYRINKDFGERLTRLSAMLTNALLLPGPIDKQGILVLESLQAHVEAFRRATVRR